MGKKKLVAFLTAFSMLSSMSLGFVQSVYADGVTKGINLTYDSESSTADSKVVKLYYVGAEGILGASLSFTFDTNEVTAAEFTPAWDKGANVTPNTNSLAEGMFAFNMTVTADDPLTSSDNLLGTITFKVSETTPSFDVVIDTTSNLSDENEKTVYCDATSVTVVGYTDSTVTDEPTTVPTDEPTQPAVATPETTIRPIAIPIATETATEATTETVETPPAVNAGVKLVYDSENSSSTSKVVKMYYEGAEGILGASVSVTFDAAVAGVTNAVFTPAWDKGANVTPNTNSLAEGMFAFNMTVTADDPLSSQDKLLGTITLTVPENTPSFKLSVDPTSNLSDENEKTVYCADTWVMVDGSTATEAPTKAPTVAPTAFPADTTIALKDILATGYPETYTEDGVTYTLVAVAVTATKADGSAAVYGTDYSATYKKALTADEYHNAIYGYTDTIAEVIDQLVFNTKYGVTFKAAPMYQTEENKAKSEAGEEAEAIILRNYEGSKTAEKPVTPTAVPTAVPTAAPTGVPTSAPTTAPRGGGGGGSSSHSGATIANGNVTGGSTTDTVVANSFTDLGSVPWAVTAINVLAGNGIVNGVAPGIFDPLSPVTRAQFTKMVCITFGVAPITPATPRFTDVAPSDWFYSYVEAAAATGIVKGVSETAFDPNALITREQMATMMYRAMTVSGATVKTGAPAAFLDAASISAYAVEAVNTLSSAGIINGMDDGRFAPQETANRAQAACIIYQYFLALAK